MSDTAATLDDRRAFYLRKAHSLSGIVPIGGFLLVHLYSNHSATISPEHFDEKVEWINNMPFVLALEIFGIWLPILFHGIVGMLVVFEGKSNVARYGFSRNFAYSMQRLTGVFSLAFIVFHFVQFRGMAREDFLPQHGASPYQAVQDALVEPWVLAFYVLGLLAVVYHFANGLWGFMVSWGIVIGPRAQKLAAMACAGVGVALLALGMDSILAFLPKDYF